MAGPMIVPYQPQYKPGGTSFCFRRIKKPGAEFSSPPGFNWTIGISIEVSITRQDSNYYHHKMRVLRPPRVQSTHEYSYSNRGGAHEPPQAGHSSNHWTKRRAPAPELERMLPGIHRFLKSPFADSSRFIT
jgi:hypothetical protein